MKVSHLVRTLCAVSLSAVCVMGVAGCSNNNSNSDQGAIAASINGVNIYENTVTDYIQAIREQSGLTDEDTWGQYLAQMGTTPSEIREQIIDNYVSRELIKEGAEEKGITVDSSEIDSYVDKMKANYDSDEKWQEALSQAGMTEQEYRDELDLQLKAKDLYATFASTDEPSNDDMLQYAQMYASAYDGAKRSSHILFSSDDEATAQEVLNKINSGELDFATAAKQYSTDTSSASEGGDVGWDKTNSFVTEYTDALNNLSKDQVSGLVTSTYGWACCPCSSRRVKARSRSASTARSATPSARSISRRACRSRRRWTSRPKSPTVPRSRSRRPCAWTLRPRASTSPTAASCNTFSDNLRNRD